MISLNKFLEVIEVDTKPIGSKYKAYRMDGGREKCDMRSYLGLGSCSTCDYFLISKNIVLIEDKRLSDKVESIKKNLVYLKEDDKELKEDDKELKEDDKVNYVLKELIKILRYKVYGSLLMLSLLALQCKKFPKEKIKYDFWFVDSRYDPKDVKWFQFLESNLVGDLHSHFTSNFIEEVIVMNTDGFKKELQNAFSTLHDL